MLPSVPSSHMRMPPRRFTMLAATFASASDTAKDQPNSSGQLFTAGPKARKLVLQAPYCASTYLLRRFLRPAAALATVSDTP